MHHIWEQRLLRGDKLRTVDGRKVRVIDPGKVNTDAGPDFFNAKIKIDDELWAGDVEMHVRASDWFRHGHQNDTAYDSVVLHVVHRDDMAVQRPSTNEVIPQMVMDWAPDFVDRYRVMVNDAPMSLPCSKAVMAMQGIYRTAWLTRLGHERLQDKSERILSLLSHTTNNWEEACYITLARALGSGTNGDAFQRLALSTPVKLILRQSDNILSIESLLFGQAGLLEEVHPENEYFTRLQQEYRYLQKKFGIKPAPNLNWKQSRMRPANFPHRRIALLASFLSDGFALLWKILNAKGLDDLRRIFNKDMSGYWVNHFNFNMSAICGYLTLSDASIDSLIINVAVPMLYCYAENQATGDEAEAYRAKALEYLESIKPEKNFITTMFKNAGIGCKDAFTSQAMIQLRRNYCEQRKCIYCAFGHKVLSNSVG